MEYKNYKIPDADIDALIDNLQVSIFDACELWLSDHGEVTNDEQDALTECAKGQRRYERAGVRKSTHRERKIDETKAELLKIIANALKNDANIIQIAQKTETELHFAYENAEYTVKLTKHRPKKA